MQADLVRTTTYFESDVLSEAKISAIRQKKPLYKIINQKLREALKLPGSDEKARLSKKPFRLEDYLIIKPLGLKGKKFKRSWAYE